MQNMMALQTEMFLDVEVRHQRFMGVITIILFPTETVPSIVQWDSYEVYLKFETNYDIELTWIPWVIATKTTNKHYNIQVWQLYSSAGLPFPTPTENDMQ